MNPNYLSLVGTCPSACSALNEQKAGNSLRMFGGKVKGTLRRGSAASTGTSNFSTPALFGSATILGGMNKRQSRSDNQRMSIGKCAHNNIFFSLKGTSQHGSVRSLS